MPFKKNEKKSLVKSMMHKINEKTNCSKVRESFSRVLEIPAYLISNTSKLTAIDNNTILIEGYKNVEDYYSHYIKVCTNSITVIIDGKNLDIKEITNEDLIITGELFSINFKK